MRLHPSSKRHLTRRRWQLPHGSAPEHLILLWRQARHLCATQRESAQALGRLVDMEGNRTYAFAVRFALRGWPWIASLR